jgi:hypothetical protein
MHLFMDTQMRSTDHKEGFAATVQSAITKQLTGTSFFLLTP